MSNFKYEEVNFVPLYPLRKVNQQNAFVPTPEVIYLTNLRETVVAVANLATPVTVRRNFMNRNPIPGAIYNNNSQLTNPDAIMPQVYTAETLRNDLYDVKAWIEAATDLKNNREKWFTKISLLEPSTGNESMLVSSEPENLRITTNADGRSTVQGDITVFWYRNKMSDQMVFYGTYHLAAS